MSQDSYNFDVNVSTRGLEKVYSDLKDLDKLIDQINKKPVIIKVRHEGLNAAVRGAKKLSDQLDKIAGRTVKYNVTANHQNVNQPGIPGGGGGSRPGAGGNRHGIAGIFAHAVPVQLYNLVNTIRAMAVVSARVSAMGSRLGPVAGAAVGVGAGAAAIGIGVLITAVHAHKAALNIATSILSTAFHAAAAGAVQFAGHMFQVIEETRRARTTFAALATMDTKMSLSELRQVDPARYNQALQISEKIANQMRNISVETGQSYGSVVGAAKSLIPDILDKMNRKYGDSKNALVSHGEEVMNITSTFIRLGAVMRMADPLGKNLAAQIFPLQEILSGTSGKKASAELFTSLRKRTGIKISGEDATNIANAVNSNDITRAVELLRERMARAGVSITMLSDMFENTLTPNIDGVKNLMTGIFTPMGDVMFDSALRMMKNLRARLTSVSMSFAGDEKNQNAIQNRLKNFALSFRDKLIESFLGTTALNGKTTKIGNVDKFITGFFDPSVMSDSKSPQNAMLKSVSASVNSFIELMAAVGGAIFQLIAGFANLGDTKGMSQTIGEITKAITQIQPQAYEFGVSLRNFVENIAKLIPQLMGLALKVQQVVDKIVYIMGPLLYLTGGAGGGIGGFNPQNNQSGWYNPNDNADSGARGAGLGSSRPTGTFQFGGRSIQYQTPMRQSAIPPAPQYQATVPQNIRFPGAQRPQPIAVPKTEVKITSSPNLRNEINVKVTPQLDQLVAMTREAAKSGAEEGTKRANAQNQTNLSGMLANWHGNLINGMNAAANNSAPTPSPTPGK